MGGNAQTVRALAYEVDGKVVAVAGYFWNGHAAMVFSDMREGADVPKITIWREALKFMTNITLPAICVATPGSEKFLERLGWQHAGTSEFGEVYQCNF